MKNKYLEYYMDSKIYSKNEVQQSIDNTKKEFPNKKIDVQVYLNKFSVYIVTFTFRNKDSFFKNIFIKLKVKRKNKLLLAETMENRNINNVNQIIRTKKAKQEKLQQRFEKYYDRKYGEYKKTGIYRPY